MYLFQLNAYIAMISLTMLVSTLIILCVLKVLEKIEKYNEDRTIDRKEFQELVVIWFKGIAIFTYVHLLIYLTLVQLFPEWSDLKIL